MDQQEFEDLLSNLVALGHELTHVEAKGPGSFEGSLRSKVIRAMLGMANRRDGGFIIIGLEDKDSKLVPTGLDPSHLPSWSHDDISDQVAKYADPSIRFTRQEFVVDGKSFLLLSIEEFDSVPVLCKNNIDHGSQQILRRGACYVRPRRKHETSEIATYEDMRELIDLAVEKQVSRYSHLRRITEDAEEDSNQLFRGEVQQLESDEIIQEIMSRGYWAIDLRPNSYVSSLIDDYSILENRVSNAAVAFGGWQFPYVSGGHSAISRRLQDSYTGGIRWDTYKEIWRIYQNGHFVCWTNMWIDWLDQQERFIHREIPMSWRSGALLPIVDTIRLLEAIVEFAGRLVRTLATGDAWMLSITANGLRGRALWQPDPRRYLIPLDILAFPHAFELDRFHWSLAIDPTNGSYSPRELSNEAALDLFKRAGWDPGIETIRAIRGEIDW